MKRRKRSRKLVSGNPQSPREAPEQPVKADFCEDDKGMDFGGLPPRDLKKNLGGCG